MALLFRVHFEFYEDLLGNLERQALAGTTCQSYPRAIVSAEEIGAVHCAPGVLPELDPGLGFG